MRFFGIDQHISVIADMKKIFNDLGHTIDDKCLSGHAFVMNRKADSIPMLDGENWCGFDEREDWDKFYDLYKDELNQYDGFICCYPPIFGLLYKRFNKPIILNIPIRYDYAVHHHPERLQKFNQFLKDGVHSGKIFLMSNNLFDKYYCENFTGLKVTHIPSLCEYFTYKHDPDNTNGEFLYYARTKRSDLDGIGTKKEIALRCGYSWNDVVKYKGIIHFPYQVSTMSIFEQYTANIPLFVPSHDFMLDLYKEDYSVLWHYSPFLLAEGRDGKKSSIIGTSKLDPNDYENLESVSYWLQYADYYDTEWMPFVNKFGSVEELKDQIHSLDFYAVSQCMKINNIVRKREVYRMWKSVLKGVESVI